MANKRTAELEIKLQGAQTLEQLNDTLEEINNEIKDVDKNSESFKELASLARKADAEVSELDESLKGVTSDEKADGFLKMGEGIAGAFAAVQGLTTAFGGTSEELDKVIAKVGGMILALDGIKKVTEALNSTQRKIFRETIAGWKKSALAAKLFGTTTKKALTATGIGIFIVLLGTLIANWDDVTEAVGGFVESIPLIGDMVKWITKLSESVGGLGKVFSAIGAGILGFFKTGTSAVEGFDKAIAEAQFQKNLVDAQEAIEKASKGFESSQKRLELNLININKLYDKNINDLKRRILLEEDINNKKILQLELNKLEIDKEKERIKIINSNQKESAKLFNTRTASAKLINKEIDDLKKEKNIRDIISKTEKKHRLEINKLARDFIEENKERIELHFGVDLEDTALVEKEISNFIERAVNPNLFISSIRELEKGVDFIFQAPIKGMENLLLKTGVISEEGLKSEKNLEKTVKETNDEYVKKIENLKKEISSKDEIVKLDGDIKKINDSIAEKEAEIILLTLENTKLISGGLIDKEKLLDLDNQLLLVNRELSKLNAKEPEKKREIIDLEHLQLNALNLQLKNWKDIRDENLKLLEQRRKGIALTALELTQLDEYQKRVQKIIDNQKLFGGIFGQTDVSIRKTAGVIEKEMNAELFNTKLLLEEGYNALEIFEMRMDFIAEKISFFGQLTIDALQAPITFLDGRVEKLNQELDILTDKELDNAARLAEINGLLADAQGDRHQQLLADKEEEMKINGDIANQQLDIEKKLIKASEARAKFQKAQNITSALINTSLAVVQALPNIPLSILVGIIGAANVAAIASQPLPAIPQFVVGGYTEHGNKNDVAGVVHKSEYIIPKDVLETDMGSQLAAMLESMRIGFASGGFTSNAPDSSTSLPSLTNVIGQEQQFVSVVEIESVGRNVKVLESRSSL